MRVLLYLYFLLIFGCNDYGALTYVTKLPKKLKENSGIVTLSGDLCWFINDSGNKDHIYGVDFNGNLIRDINIKNAKNHDWEDLTKDAEGNIYIADIGNNANNRKDLVIYKITNPELTDSSDLEAQKIKFSYSDQDSFPPAKENFNYNAEAIIYHNGFLYIFTKNNTTPFNGLTKCYKLPAKPGEHVAKLIATVYICNQKISCQVTGAAISPNGKTLALLTSNSVWLLDNFSEETLSKKPLKRIPLEHFSQKESICFLDNHTLLISDEQQGPTGRNLYKISLKPKAKPKGKS